MKDLRKSAMVSMALEVMSVLGVIICHLALNDIWHGEGDLTLEWNALRVSFFVISMFQVSAFTTLRRMT